MIPLWTRNTWDHRYYGLRKYQLYFVQLKCLNYCKTSFSSRHSLEREITNKNYTHIIPTICCMFITIFIAWLIMCLFDFCPISSATKEMSFVHAISTAGVMYTLTKNCSMGHFSKCGCDNTKVGQQGMGLTFISKIVNLY